MRNDKGPWTLIIRKSTGLFDESLKNWHERLAIASSNTELIGMDVLQRLVDSSITKPIRLSLRMHGILDFDIPMDEILATAMAKARFKAS